MIQDIPKLVPFVSFAEIFLQTLITGHFFKKNKQSKCSKIKALPSYAYSFRHFETTVWRGGESAVHTKQRYCLLSLLKYRNHQKCNYLIKHGFQWRGKDKKN